MRFLDFVCFLSRLAAVKTIRAYQKTFSPDHGPMSFLYPFGFCKHKPSCSQYAIDAINKYGVLQGGVRSARRVLRCNPFSKGGKDEA